MKKTTTNFKTKNKPRTVLEKFDYMSGKNSDLKKLRTAFDLDLLF